MPTHALELVPRDDLVVEVCESRLDEGNAEAVARHLCGLVQASAPSRLLLDLRNVQYLTSTFLAGLLTLQRLLKTAGGQLVLSDVNPLVYEVLEVTRLTQVFEVHPRGEADIQARPA